MKKKPGRKKSGVDKVCEACGASFYVQAFRAEEAKFCSMKCLWIGRPPPEKKHPVTLVCANCGKDFSVRPYRKDIAKFCSPRCGALASGDKLKKARAAKRKPGVKICSKCGLEKLHSDFWKHDTSSDGLRGVCIPCRQEVHDQWVTANPGKKAEADRRYYAEHAADLNRVLREKYAADPQGFAERNRKWRADNPGKVAASNRAKRQRHGEKMRSDRRQHYQDNKSRYKAQAVARQKHIKQATPPWADLEKIAAFYAEAERLTRETGIPHHVDHIYPLRGKTMCGLHVEGNLQILHAVVNLRKSNMVDAGIEALHG